MRRLGTLLLLLALATAPGCRVIAGAAVIVGEVVLDGLADDCDGDGGDPPRHERRAPRPNPRRHAERDPAR